MIRVIPWRVCVLAIAVSACTSPGATGGPRATAGPDDARRAADYAWRCEQITGQNRLTCLDQLPWRVPGYFGDRTDLFRAPEPRR